MDIVACCNILHNLLIDYGDAIPDEWYDELAEEIKWAVDFETEEEMVAEGRSWEFEGGHWGFKVDRREAAFHSLIENYY